jgi:hypothetical protein
MLVVSSGMIFILSFMNSQSSVKKFIRGHVRLMLQYSVAYIM